MRQLIAHDWPMSHCKVASVEFMPHLDFQQKWPFSDVHMAEMPSLRDADVAENNRYQLQLQLQQKPLTLGSLLCTPCVLAAQEPDR